MGTSAAYELNRRKTSRAHVILSGTVSSAAFVTDVRLANVGPGGALIIGLAQPLRRHERVSIVRDRLEVRSRVVWSEGDRAGVQFDQEVAPAAMLRVIQRPRRRPVARTRRPGLKCAPLSAYDYNLLFCWSASASANGNG